MEITNPINIRLNGQPCLQVTIDGVDRIVGDLKATFIRHGVVYIGDENYSASLPGQVLEGASDDPRLFRLAVVFGESLYRNTFQEGPASDQVSDQTIKDLGDRLAAISDWPGSPPWSEIVARLEQTH